MELVRLHSHFRKWCVQCIAGCIFHKSIIHQKSNVFLCKRNNEKRFILSRCVFMTEKNSDHSSQRVLTFLATDGVDYSDRLPRGRLCDKITPPSAATKFQIEAAIG